MEKQTKEQLTVTIATRFDQETASILRDLAREKGIGITTLIRMWILDRVRRLDRVNRKREYDSGSQNDQS